MGKQPDTVATAGSGDCGWGKLSAWWPCGVLCLWALAIRVLAAGKVFPAQGDASHFIQYGKAYAVSGLLESLNGLWSLAPQFLTAWSMKLGWIPQYVLQATTVAFGVLVVAGGYALTLELTRSRMAAFAAGLLLATSPVLTAAAASGLSDTPHIALATWTVSLAFAGVRKRHAGVLVLAALVAVVDIYYRPYDLGLYFFGAGPFILWRLRDCGWLRAARLLAPGAVVGVIASLPFFFITSATSSWNPGRSKLSNLAYGDAGYSATEMYAAKGLGGDKTQFAIRMKELETKGVGGFVWSHRWEILRRYPKNVAIGLRDLNGHMFEGMFRMGLFWFLVLTISCAQVSGKTVGGYAMWAIAVVIGALSIGFVNGRWIMQCMPFHAVLLGSGLSRLAGIRPSVRLRLLLYGLLVFAGLLNGRWAVAKLDDEWRQRNLFSVCERLHQLMPEDERLMCFHPELPALFYQTDALNWENIPYDSVEGVFALAEARGVDCIVLNDSVFTHFPIHEIEQNPDLIPAPWREIDRMEFEQETRFELERDVYRFYRKDGR